MHLLCAIADHGFGHLAIAAPVLNELARRRPNLRLTVWSGPALPPAKVAERVTHPFEHAERHTELGILQRNALDVDLDATLAAYERLHADWPAVVSREAEAIAACAPDLVVADASYTALAGARAVGVASAGLCSLNWADVFAAYFGGRAEAEPIHAQMLAAYRGADAFVAPEPALPMADLDRVVRVGPIAARGTARREELTARLDLRPDERVAVVAAGGMALAMDADAWPHAPGVRWIVPDDWTEGAPGVSTRSQAGLPFLDLLASCDALVTKPGYGSITEAAVCGTPALLVPRDDWPEHRGMVDWLARHGRCRAITRRQLEAGEMADDLRALLAAGRPTPIAPTGAAEAAAALLKI